MSEHGHSAECDFPWEQGSLLPDSVAVQPLQWVHPNHPATRIARGAVTAARRRSDVTAPIPVPGGLSQGDRMMVTSQSCDLIKPAQELPQVEVARVFATEKTQVIAQAQDFGSARYFRVGSFGDSRVAVLDYGYRALLDKGFLDAVAPDNVLLTSWSEDDRERLARWLGRRYSRPAISDEDHELITRPTREAWKQLLEEDPDAAQRFNHEYAEWRYRREEDGSLTIYILSPKPNPDEVTALEVADFLTDAIQPTYEGAVRVATDHRSYHTFTKADELSTEQISMEWASQDESAGAAALPPA
jgi:hypothetical protein